MISLVVGDKSGTHAVVRNTGTYIGVTLSASGVASHKSCDNEDAKAILRLARMMRQFFVRRGINKSYRICIQALSDAAGYSIEGSR
jgi:hypothetical protein